MPHLLFGRLTRCQRLRLLLMRNNQLRSMPVRYPTAACPTITTPRTWRGWFVRSFRVDGMIRDVGCRLIIVRPPRLPPRAVSLITASMILPFFCAVLVVNAACLPTVLVGSLLPFCGTFLVCCRFAGFLYYLRRSLPVLLLAFLLYRLPAACANITHCITGFRSSVVSCLPAATCPFLYCVQRAFFPAFSLRAG